MPPSGPPLSTVRPTSGRNWPSRRQIGLGIFAVKLLVLGVVALKPDPPVDTRAVVLPAYLAGQPQTQDPEARAQQEDLQQKAEGWWPGRQVAVAYYDSALLAPDPARTASSKGQRGAHLTVVRGRFEGTGDAHLFDRVDALPGLKVEHSTRQVGENTCQWTSNVSIVVCSRETDQLSISVLKLDGSTPDEVAAEVDEVWADVR